MSLEALAQQPDNPQDPVESAAQAQQNGDSRCEDGGEDRLKGEAEAETEADQLLRLQFKPPLNITFVLVTAVCSAELA